MTALQQISPAPKGLWIVCRSNGGGTRVRPAAALGITADGEGVVLDADAMTGALFPADESGEFVRLMWE